MCCTWRVLLSEHRCLYYSSAMKTNTEIGKYWMMWIMHRIIQLLSWLLIRNRWSSAPLSSQSMTQVFQVFAQLLQYKQGHSLPCGNNSGLNCFSSASCHWDPIHPPSIPLHSWIKVFTEGSSTALPTLRLVSYCASVLVLVFHLTALAAAICFSWIENNLTAIRLGHFSVHTESFLFVCLFFSFEGIKTCLCWIKTATCVVCDSTLCLGVLQWYVHTFWCSRMYVHICADEH